MTIGPRPALTSLVGVTTSTTTRCSSRTGRSVSSYSRQATRPHSTRSTSTSTHTSNGQAQQTTSFSPSCYPTPTLSSHPHTHGTHRNVTTSSRSAPLIASNNAQSGPSAVSNSHSHITVPPTAGPSSSHAYSSSASSTSGSSTSSSSGSGGFGASSGHGQAGSGGSAAGSGSASSGGGAGGSAGKKRPSRHMIWYREIVPAMLPVIAIGTGVFFALQLTQTHLSHSRSLSSATARITQLEEELAELSARQRRQAASWGDGLGRVVRMVMMERDGNAAGQGLRSEVGNKEKKEELNVGDNVEGKAEGKRSRWSWFR